MAVVAPQRPILSVVHGSVQMGLNRTFVSSHCMPKTFGMVMTMHMAQAKKEYPNLKDEFFRMNKIGLHCSGFLHIFVKCGQEVQLHEVRQEFLLYSLLF